MILCTSNINILDLQGIDTPTSLPSRWLAAPKHLLLGGGQKIPRRVDGRFRRIGPADFRGVSGWERKAELETRKVCGTFLGENWWKRWVF